MFHQSSGASTGFSSTAGARDLVVLDTAVVGVAIVGESVVGRARPARVRESRGPFVNESAQPASSTWPPGTFLAGLSPAATTELLGLGVRREFAPGRVMLREGDRNSHVEMLVSGFAKVTTIVAGVEALLSIRLAGDIVGEIGALTGQPRTATVVACGRVASFVVSHADFHRFLRSYPEAAVGVTAAVGAQLRWANRRRTDFAAYPAHQRLARVLLEIAEACGRRTSDGVEIGVTLTQPELATMIGVAEATVQKALHELRGRGLIRTGYRRITVLDLPGLRAMSEIVD
jgi:CRP/FNR family transcriptional regulator, cyclic AMP receptor protein